MTSDKRFLSVEDVMEITGMSRNFCYILIRQLNDELSNKGYLTVRARVISTYFYERFFGKEKETHARLQR